MAAEYLISDLNYEPHRGWADLKRVDPFGA